MNMPKLYQPTQIQQLASRVFSTSIPGLLYLEQTPKTDERGFFCEVAVVETLREVTGEVFSIKQMNHSRSVTNVVRGMHAEGWNKLITPTSGVAFCALADIRPESDTFGKVEYFLIGHGGAAQPAALFIPQGVANSFCVIEGPLDYLYAVDKLYTERDPKGDAAISIFDPDLAIQWPIPKEQMIISQRDEDSISLRQAFPQKFE